MHHHACRFINDHQLIILINHIQWNILRLYCRVIVWPVQHQRDDIASSHLVIALHRPVVDMHETGICRLLDAVARGVPQMLHHILVYTQRLLARVDHHPDMLV